MFSTKILAACAIVAAAATGADAFAPGAALPTGLRTKAASCSVSMQMQKESVADILARAAAMANGSVQATHAGGNRHTQPAPQAAAPAQSYSAPAAASGSESVAAILARAAAMAGQASSIQSSYNAPSAAPAATQTVNRGAQESVADILARAAAMANGSVQATHAGGNRHTQPAPAAAPSYSAPAQSYSAPAAPKGESVADILARAAAMANGSVQATHAGGNRHTQPAPSAAPSYSAPAPSYSAPAPSSGDSVADILARAAAMANGSVQPTHAGGNRARN